MKECQLYRKVSLSSPVVSAGVHSCSPVAPQRSVFDGVTVDEVPKVEFITEVFRFWLTNDETQDIG